MIRTGATGLPLFVMSTVLEHGECPRQLLQRRWLVVHLHPHAAGRALIDFSDSPRGSGIDGATLQYRDHGCSCARTLPTISKPCLGLTASGSSHTKMAENIDGALLALLRRPTAINVRAVIRPETMPPTSKPHKSRG